MLFHTPKLPAEIRISHLNARVNEQRKKIAQTTASKLELLQLAQQLAKEGRARKKITRKFMSSILKATYKLQLLKICVKKSP